MKKLQTRDNLIKMYLESLKEDKIPWQKNWKNAKAPFNAFAGNTYKGINSLILSYIADKRGYKDPRWMTFNQANKLGYKIKTRPEDFVGDYGVKIEYWAIYDPLTKRNITFDKYEQIKANDLERAKKMRLVNRSSTVFNGQQIAGLPPYIHDEEPEFAIDEVLKNLVNNMDVRVKEGGSNACYIPDIDTIEIPSIGQFKSEYGFNCTLLHELAHSTGHKSRLDRDLKARFGTEEYAREELRAEISSSFVSQKCGFDIDDGHLDNHKAYIQSWISILENDPNELFKAIKEAEVISDYMIEKSDLVYLKEKTHEIVL